MKAFRTYIIILISSILILTSCSNSSSHTHITVNKLSVDDINSCKEIDYKNLDLSHCHAVIPKIDTIHELEVDLKSGDSVDNKQFVEKFREYVKHFFGEVNDEYLLFQSDSKEISNLQQKQLENAKQGDYTWYPKVSDYKQKIADGSVSILSLLYRDTKNSYYLWQHKDNAFPHWINKGQTIKSLDSKDIKVSSWSPTDLKSKVETVYNDGQSGSKEYKLKSENVSVEQAVSYFEKEYLKSLPCGSDGHYSLFVTRTDVYKVGSDTYGYLLNFSPAYDGVPFDSKVESVSAESGGRPFADIYQAFMVSGNDVDVVINLRFPKVTPSENAIEKIVPMQKAFDIASESLTDQVTFRVDIVQFVYSGQYNEDYTKASLRPMWKICAYNPNDEYNYDVYVDAQSAECTYRAYKSQGD